ncbi:MAG: HlyD family efflux transporter periplasmic adaptor subunit [Desulfamplus sp.]|nr:HlyD family efflux transporter periplasmic adaptor subunit [Desulfamplus sp.]
MKNIVTFCLLCFLWSFFLSLPENVAAVDSEDSQDAKNEQWYVEGAIKQVELRGYTRSIRSATISSEVSGRVVKVNYEVGDSLLVLKDAASGTGSSSSYGSGSSSSGSSSFLSGSGSANDNRSADNLSNDSDSGYVSFAEIDSTFVDFDIQSTKIAIAQTRTRLKQIDSKIKYLKNEFRRKEELFTKGRSTEVVKDAASQELEQAILERETARQSELSLNITLNQLIEKKKRHMISGNSDWVVTDRKVEAGEMVQAGIPIGVIQDFRHLVVPLAVSNEELDSIKELGDIFEATLDNKPVKASIYYVNPAFNEQTRKTDIKMLIINNDENGNGSHENSNGENIAKKIDPDGMIDTDEKAVKPERKKGLEHRGGLEFVLPVSVRAKGLRVPVQAVENRYENPKVYVKGKAEPVMITVVDKSEGFIVIAEHPELAPGTVLTTPAVQQE